MLATSAPALPQETSRREHYVGILMAYFEAINPTDAERIEMGLVTREQLDSGQRQPVNYREDDGRLRLDFWLKGKDESGREIRVRHSVFIKNEESRPSAVGNIQVINHQGKSAYIGQAFFDKGQSPYPDWFTAPYHRARVGEADLLQFVNAWTNKKSDDKALPLDFAAISQGNLKALHQVMQSDKASYVKLMLGVRIADDGRRYQTVFPRVILPSWTVNYERLHKELTNYLSNAQSRNEYGVTPDMAYDRRLYRLRLHEEAADMSFDASQTSDDMPNYAAPTMKAAPATNRPEPPAASIHDDELPF